MAQTSNIPNYGSFFGPTKAEQDASQKAGAAAQSAATHEDAQSTLDSAWTMAKGGVGALKEFGKGVIKGSPIGAAVEAERGNISQVPGVTGALEQDIMKTPGVESLGGEEFLKNAPLLKAGATAATTAASAVEFWGYGKAFSALAGPVESRMPTLFKGVLQKAAQSIGISMGDQEAAVVGRRVLASGIVGGGMAGGAAATESVIKGRRPTAREVGTNVALGAIVGAAGGAFEGSAQRDIAKRVDNIHNGLLSVAEKQDVQDFSNLAKSWGKEVGHSHPEAMKRLARIMVGRGSDVDRISIGQFADVLPEEFKGTLGTDLLKAAKSGKPGIEVPSVEDVYTMLSKATPAAPGDVEMSHGLPAADVAPEEVERIMQHGSYPEEIDKIDAASYYDFYEPSDQPTTHSLLMGRDTLAGRAVRSTEAAYTLPAGSTVQDVPRAPKMLPPDLTDVHKGVLQAALGSNWEDLESAASKSGAHMVALGQMVVNDILEPKDIRDPNMASTVSSFIREMAEDADVPEQYAMLQEYANKFDDRAVELRGSETNPDPGVYFVRDPATGDVVRVNDAGPGKVAIIDKRGKVAVMNEEDAPSHVLKASLDEVLAAKGEGPLTAEGKLPEESASFQKFIRESKEGKYRAGAAEDALARRHALKLQRGQMAVSDAGKVKTGTAAKDVAAINELETYGEAIARGKKEGTIPTEYSVHTMKDVGTHNVYEVRNSRGETIEQFYSLDKAKAEANLRNSGQGATVDMGDPNQLKQFEAYLNGKRPNEMLEPPPTPGTHPVGHEVRLKLLKEVANEKAAMLMHDEWMSTYRESQMIPERKVVKNFPKGADWQEHVDLEKKLSRGIISSSDLARLKSLREVHKGKLTPDYIKAYEDAGAVKAAKAETARQLKGEKLAAAKGLPWFKEQLLGSEKGAVDVGPSGRFSVAKGGEPTELSQTELRQNVLQNKEIDRLFGDRAKEYKQAWKNENFEKVAKLESELLPEARKQLRKFSGPPAGKTLPKGGLFGYEKGALQQPRGKRITDTLTAKVAAKMGAELWQVPEGIVTKLDNGDERIWPTQQHAFEYLKGVVTGQRVVQEQEQVLNESVAHLNKDSRTYKRAARAAGKATNLPVSDLRKAAIVGKQVAALEPAEQPPLLQRLMPLKDPGSALRNTVTRQHAKLMTYGEGGIRLANLAKVRNNTREYLQTFMVRRIVPTLVQLKRLGYTVTDIENGTAPKEVLDMFDKTFGATAKEAYETMKALGGEVAPEVTGKRYVHHWFNLGAKDIPDDMLQEAIQLGIANSKEGLAKTFNNVEDTLTPNLKTTSKEDLSTYIARVKWAREKATSVAHALESERRGNTGYNNDLEVMAHKYVDSVSARLADVASFGPKDEAINHSLALIANNSSFSDRTVWEAAAIMNDVRGKTYIPMSTTSRMAGAALRLWLGAAGPKHLFQNVLPWMRFGTYQFAKGTLETALHGVFFGEGARDALYGAGTVGWAAHELGEHPDQFLQEGTPESLSNLQQWARTARLPDLPGLLGRAGTASLHVFLNAGRINAWKIATNVFPKYMEKALAGDQDAIAVLSETLHAKVTPEFLKSVDAGALKTRFAKEVADWEGMTYRPEDFPAFSRSQFGRELTRFRVFRWNLFHNIFNELNNPNFSYARRAKSAARLLMALPVLGSLDPTIRHKLGIGTISSETAYDAWQRWTKDPTHVGKAAYMLTMLAAHSGVFGLAEDQVEGWNQRNQSIIERSAQFSPAIVAPLLTSEGVSARVVHSVLKNNPKEFKSAMTDLAVALSPSVGAGFARATGARKPVRLPKQMVIREMMHAGP